MDVLVSLPVVVPLLTAAVLAASSHFLARRADDIAGIAAAAATTGLSIALVVQSLDHDLVYWFGGWKPRHGLALGVAFDVEPLSAALAALAGLLATAVFVYAWRYFDEVGTLFHVLMLVFLAALCGFVLSGDLFSMFVFFELMSVCAYALVGYGIEAAPLQGAINFAVTNTVGSMFFLSGIALLYGRTGALNLAQIGRVLAGNGADGLVLVSFGLLLAGFLIKAGAVPFHFWLADAYAVAPVPVCVLLSGVMSDLGLHAIARIYWPVYSGVFGADAGSLRAVLVGAGVLTALVGGTMAFFERDLKRMLAFVTISQVGVFLAGVGLLTARGLAGSTLMVLASGLVKGALFLAVGILVSRAGSDDELRLRGIGRRQRLPFAAACFFAGGLLVAGLPPFAAFPGWALLVRSAGDVGYSWLPAVLALAAALAGGPVLRAAARVFLGWGDADDPLLSKEPSAGEDEPDVPSSRLSPPLLFGPPLALLLLAVAFGFVPGLAGHAAGWATRFEDRPAHAAEVLAGKPPAPVRSSGEQAGAAAYGYGFASTAGALAVAAFGLYRRRLPGGVRRLGGRVLEPPVATLKALHSGVIGDYVAWLTFGAATLGGLVVLAIRG